MNSESKYPKYYLCSLHVTIGKWLFLCWVVWNVPQELILLFFQMGLSLKPNLPAQCIHWSWLICVKTIPFLCFIMWIETIIHLGRDLTFVLFLFKAITLAKRNLLHYIFNWNHSPEQVRCLVQWWGNKILKIILNKISFCYIFLLILMFLELHRNNLNVFNTIITKDLNSVLLDSTLISSAFILFQKW